MKKGRDIVSLATELDRIRNASRDLIVPTSMMSIGCGYNEFNESLLQYKPGNGERLGITDWAHQQIATYSGIPKGYYDKLLIENHEILASCINHGLQMAINLALTAKRQKTEARLVRITNGEVRAFLSDKYRILDSYDLFNVVAPILIDNNFEVISSQITNKRMYIKATTPKIIGEVKPGHAVQYGIVISSSDVGAGSVRVEPLLYELVCKNGMIMEQTIKKMHIGKSQVEDEITELLTDETKKAQDEVFWMTIRDTVKGTMREDIFSKNLNMLRDAANQEITGDVPKIVELAMKEINISGDGPKNDMIKYLANGADGRGLNKWSLANAFTWAAQSDLIDYDVATDYEKAGAKIIELSPERWRILNKEAA